MSDYSDLDLPPDAVLVRGLLEPDQTFVDSERFKTAMRAFATGVVIVTVEVEGGRLLGLTINSCCSISTRPPSVLISLAHTASAREPLLARGRFGLSILAERHRELAELGAVPGGPKEVDVFAERLESVGTAAIAGALAHLDCTVSRTFEVADHTLVVGIVDRAVVGDGNPLVYYDREFRRLGEPFPPEKARPAR
ncbi:MAG TPA: flavin reductase family protein [Gaiellaceae bacterium]|nr:flavin reductase family protein [Gaiellaceae bacterium]